MISIQLILQQLFTTNFTDFLIILAGVHNYSSRHLEEAVKFISKTIDRFPYEVLLSPPYKLEEFDLAVKEALKQSYLRVVIEP